MRLESGEFSKLALVPQAWRQAWSLARLRSLPMSSLRNPGVRRMYYSASRIENPAWMNAAIGALKERGLKDPSSIMQRLAVLPQAAESAAFGYG